MIEEFAPAKVNLTLCVRARRLDGYHDLESLVAFADFGDRLVFDCAGGDEFTLAVQGPTSQEAGAPEDNLVLKAAQRLASLVPSLPGGAFSLDKRLPVAAGLGGGSADAAAALRCLARAADLAPDHPAIMEAARATGADVTVCLGSKPRMMRGMGHELGPVLKLPKFALLLVNPRVSLPTSSVFSELGLKAGQPHGTQDPTALYDNSMAPEGLLPLIKASRNDLQDAAIHLQPAIADAIKVMSALGGCHLVRMSGSGATVFGLFADKEKAQTAAQYMALLKPDWFINACGLMG